MKSSTYGADRYQYEYLSYVRSLRYLLKISQQDKQYTEIIYDFLESVLINLKLDGGNMHTKKLQDKERFINPSCSDDDAAVAVEDNLVVILLIYSARDNKYGDLQRYLIKSITQGHNRYPSSKAAVYTMLCKYIPEHIKNKNESTTMRGRLATGVSF